MRGNENGESWRSAFIGGHGGLRGRRRTTPPGLFVALFWRGDRWDVTTPLPRASLCPSGREGGLAPGCLFLFSAHWSPSLFSLSLFSHRSCSTFPFSACLFPFLSSFSLSLPAVLPLSLPLHFSCPYPPPPLSLVFTVR